MRKFNLLTAAAGPVLAAATLMPATAHADPTQVQCRDTDGNPAGTVSGSNSMSCGSDAKANGSATTAIGALAEAGTGKSKLLMVNIWLSDISTFAEMNAVWDKWVSPGNAPGRATVEAKLAAPQFTVEIAVIAAK